VAKNVPVFSDQPEVMKSEPPKEETLPVQEPLQETPPPRKEPVPVYQLPSTSEQAFLCYKEYCKYYYVNVILVNQVYFHNIK